MILLEKMSMNYAKKNPVHVIMYSLVSWCDILTMYLIYNMQVNPHILIAEFHRLGNPQNDY